MLESSKPLAAERTLDANSGAGMQLGQYIQKGLQILQMDREAMRAVSRDEDALIPGMIFFAIAGLASGAGQFSLRAMLVGTVMMTLISFVGVGLLHILARLAGARSDFLELYRPLGVAAPVHWVQVVPFVGPVLGFLAVVYTLALGVVALETVGELPRPKSILVVLVFFGICLFLGLVFLAVLGSLLLLNAVVS